MACSARSVVVSTKVRPPSARAQRAASAATARRMAGLVRLREAAPARRAARARRSRTGCPRAACCASSRPADSVNHDRRSSSPSVAEVKTQALGAQRHLLAQRVADVQRRFDQPRLVRRQVDPAHRARGRGLQRTGAPARAQLGARARAASAKSGARLADGGQRFAAAARRHASMPASAPAKSASRGALVPAQLERAAHLAQRPGRRQAQLARGAVARARQSPATASRPRACCSPAPSRSRAKSITCAAAQRGAEERDAGLGELVRLVEHRHLDARQQLGDAGVAQRHVGEEQVVVDDHQVGRHRLAPRLHHMAVAELAGIRRRGSSRASR